MKTFSEPKSHDDAGGQKAQGYVASNVVMPGLGSLAAGRKVGLLQLALCLGGFGITLGFGVRFLFWALAHWAEFHTVNLDADPLKPLRDLWQQSRWLLLGIAMFTVSWLWALATSRSLLAESKAGNAGGQGNPQ